MWGKYDESAFITTLERPELIEGAFLWKWHKTVLWRMRSKPGKDLKENGPLNLLLIVATFQYCFYNLYILTDWPTSLMLCCSFAYGFPFVALLEYLEWHMTTTPVEKCRLSLRACAKDIFRRGLKFDLCRAE